MMRFSIDLIEFGKVFIIIQNSGAFDQDVLAGLSLESEPLCVRRLSTQSNSRAPIKEKVFAWAHHLMQNLFHNHHPSPITSHFKLFDSSGSLLYNIKAFQLQRQVSRGRKEFDCWDGIGSYSKHSTTNKSLRVG